MTAIETIDNWHSDSIATVIAVRMDIEDGVTAHGRGIRVCWDGWGAVLGQDKFVKWVRGGFRTRCGECFIGGGDGLHDPVYSQPTCEHAKWTGSQQQIDNMIRILKMGLV